MKLSTLVLSSGAVATCAALHLRAAAEPRVVQYDFKRHVSSGPASDSALQRRGSSTVPVTLPEDLVQVHYVINITAGTPPQSFGLGIDTGSADLVVRTAGSSICKAGNCTAYGSFDPSKSSTFRTLGIDFGQSYGEGSTANGTLASETIAFGGVTIANVTIAPANSSTITDNVFGIGFPEGEASAAAPVAGAQGFAYRNTLLKMKDAGLIQAAAYSIWLNDLSAASGSVLFGGVDTAKYSGSLQSVPVVPAGTTAAGQPYYGFLQISLDAIGTSKGTTTTLTTAAGFPISTLLDTGSGACLLPQQLVTNVCAAFGCSTNNGINFLPCSLQAPNSGNISFNFSGINITVPVGEFVRDAGVGGGNCVFDFRASTSGSYILGDSFLRSAYVVYNLDARQIALAQTVFNTSATNVLEIANSSSVGNSSNYYSGFGIPSAVNASNIRTGIPSATGTFAPAVTNAAALRSVGGAALVAAMGAFVALV